MLMLQLGLVLGESAVTVSSAEAVFFSLLKLMFIVAGLIYVVFGVIVTRQVHVMKNTLVTPFSPFIQLLGYIHLIVAILVLLFFFTL